LAWILRIPALLKGNLQTTWRSKPGVEMVSANVDWNSKRCLNALCIKLILQGGADMLSSAYLQQKKS
jgi:hypothetical protein